MSQQPQFTSPTGTTRKNSALVESMPTFQFHTEGSKTYARQYPYVHTLGGGLQRADFWDRDPESRQVAKREKL